MISIGNIDLARASIGTTDLVAISLGTVDLWTAWTDTRADKTVTQNLPQSAWTAITWDTWTGDPVVSGAVTISGASEATITAELAHSVGTTAATIWILRIVVNGTVQAEVTAAPLAVKTLIQATVTLNPGDQVAIQASAPSSGASSRRAAGGWLTITANP